MDNLINAIDMSKKLTDLLIEYQESKIYETCKYHIIKDERSNINRYFLYLIKDEIQLIYGSKENIQSYLNLRNIDRTKIYNYKVVFNSVCVL